MVALFKHEDRFELVLLRSVPDREAREAVALGDELGALENFALQRRYREALLAQAQGTDRPDVPILDLARHASGRLAWSAEQHPGNLTWVAVRVPL